jgi:hypothetical protein
LRQEGACCPVKKKTPSFYEFDIGSTKTSGLSLEMYEAGTAFKIHKVKSLKRQSRIGIDESVYSACIYA